MGEEEEEKGEEEEEKGDEEKEKGEQKKKRGRRKKRWGSSTTNNLFFWFCHISVWSFHLSVGLGF